MYVHVLKRHSKQVVVGGVTIAIVLKNNCVEAIEAFWCSGPLQNFTKTCTSPNSQVNSLWKGY